MIGKKNLGKTNSAKILDEEINHRRKKIAKLIIGEKFCIGETLNLSTDADSSTNTFLFIFRRGPMLLVCIYFFLGGGHSDFRLKILPSRAELALSNIKKRTIFCFV